MSTANNPSAAWKPKQVSSTMSPGGVTHKGADALRAYRPEHLHHLAIVVAAWGQIERTLAEIFAYAIQAEGWVAAEILEEVRNSASKIKIVRNSLEGKNFGEATPFIFDVLRELQDLQKSRNEVAHGSFLVRTDLPESIVLVEGWGRAEKHYSFDLETLKALSDRAVAIELALSTALLQVVSSTAPRHETGRMIAIQPMDFREVGEGESLRLIFLHPDGKWYNPDHSEYEG